MNSGDKVDIGVALVARLVATQFPRWAHLPITPVSSGGWDNRTFHLGEQMTVRLPSAEQYALQVEKEHRWLPKLAPLLPLPIPAPLAMGAPGEGYMWPWSIYRWLEGTIVAQGNIKDLAQFAASLAEFLTCLQRVDASDGPPPGRHNFHRGGSLTVYDGETRQAISVLGDRIDTVAATAIWETALAAEWRGTPVWFHGDVSPGNLLVDEGRLTAVIDFGTSGVGDPACDLAIAWTFFHDESRRAFRKAMPGDEAMWARGRGWTLWKALIVLAALPGTNSAEAKNAQRVLNEVIADDLRNAR
ncbi:aminoglycoside phosphotransferase family protein [Rhizobium tubonense]|uniref:aminoglycoside phosphotransferase family protein n=1 Tax=Rhizobium tubonense TaxID=484088 RepID=UPI0018A85810|nr:aminoglycoside phosphotransferase family protein [Rhizobium tubonense]